MSSERNKQRPITAEDLRWYFTESESTLGLRSALGSLFERRATKDGGVESFFCPMPRGAGAPDGEVALIRATRLRHEGGFDAIATHRRVHRALLEGPSEHIAVLRAAYGPDDWTRQLPRDVAVPVAALLRDLVNVAPLAESVRAYAARRMGPSAMPCADTTTAEQRADVTRDASGRVLCAYRRVVPVRPHRDRPSQRGKTAPATPAEAAAALFQRDPALAASPRGAVIAIACSADRTRAAALSREARRLLEAAHAAMGVVAVEPRPAKARSVQLVPTRRRELEPPEPGYVPGDGEVLAHV